MGVWLLVTKETGLGYGHLQERDIAFEEPGTKKQVVIGPTRDRRELFIGYQTRTGAHDIIWLNGDSAARLGGKIINWSKEMPRGEGGQET